MGQIADISEVLLVAGLSASVTETERAIVQEAIRMSEAAVIRHLKYDPVMRVRTEYYPQADFSPTGRQTVWEVNATSAFQRRLSESSQDTIQLKHLPVREFDEDGNNGIDVRIDYDARSGTRSGSFAAATLQVVGDDFWPNYTAVDSRGYKVCNDGLLRAEGRWPGLPGSVQVIYVSGYTAAEFHGQDSFINAAPILEAVIGESVRRVTKAYSRMKKTGVGFGTGPFSGERMGDYSYTADSSVLSALIGAGSDLMAETVDRLSEFVNFGWALTG